MSASAGSIVQGILQLEEGKITANADYRKRGVPDGYWRTSDFITSALWNGCKGYERI